MKCLARRLEFKSFRKFGGKRYKYKQCRGGRAAIGLQESEAERLRKRGYAVRVVYHKGAGLAAIYVRKRKRVRSHIRMKKRFVATNRQKETYLYERLPNGTIRTVKFLGWKTPSGKLVNHRISKTELERNRRTFRRLK